MHIAVYHNGIGLGGQLGSHGTDIVLRIVVHHIVGCNEGRHIAAGFAGQIGIDLPVVLLAARAVDGLVHILRPTVVGGNDQVPVAEYLIQVFQVVGGGIAGLHGVATLVDQRVDFQPILLTCSQHKLPQTGSPYPRHCLWIQRRLNHWQVLQLQRKVIGFECFLENGNIEIGGAQHIAHRMAQAAAVTVDKLLNHLVIGHLNHSGQTSQTVDIYLLVESGVLGARLAVVVLTKIGLRHVKVHQRVQVIGHGLGEVYHFLVAVLVSYREFIFRILRYFNLLFFVVKVVCHDLGLQRQRTGQHQHRQYPISFLHIHSKNLIDSSRLSTRRKWGY